jgi:hypothetical protein
MNAFVNAIQHQESRTENGMKARKSTASKNTDLFFKIGASRGKNIIPEFVGAYVENADHALRIAQWARDVREGSGERKLFRDILLYLGENDKEAAKALLRKVPLLGRWDDVLVEFSDVELRNYAHELIRVALSSAVNDGLCAKWMPRKGPRALELRNYLGWTPKYYRKRLVELTKVVETQMCAKDWDNINFSHVPSLASSRYKKAFNRHTPKYGEYIAKLVSGDKSVKVNAGAVYPYDVLKGLSRGRFKGVEKDHIIAQWDALPNYVGDASILPMVDVSGSMTTPVAGEVSAMDVAVSLGLYLADKNKGVFKDTFLTFTSHPELMTLKGNVIQKITQMVGAVGYDTNLHAAFDKVLDVATKNKVPQSDMPEMILILSDMQFNCCGRYDDSAIQMIERKYSEAGYNVPKVVFWNINSYDNVPVAYNKEGVALVSGFSPAIVRSVLSAQADSFTPEKIMLDTIIKTRYDL